MSTMIAANTDAIGVHAALTYSCRSFVHSIACLLVYCVHYSSDFVGGVKDAMPYVLPSYLLV